jgi:ferrous iron transport protein A
MNQAELLSELRPGQTSTVVACGGAHGLISRLAAMGFTPGSQVTVVSNYPGTPVLVVVHGSRVALGRSEAALVSVRPQSKEASA